MGTVPIPSLQVTLPRPEIVRELTDAMLEAMRDACPAASMCEVASAVFTISTAVIDQVLAHSLPEFKESNRAALEVCVQLMGECVKTPPSTIN